MPDETKSQWTHEGHEIWVDEKSGKFSASISGRTVRRASLRGIKAAIDKVKSPLRAFYFGKPWKSYSLLPRLITHIGRGDKLTDGDGNTYDSWDDIFIFNSQEDKEQIEELIKEHAKLGKKIEQRVRLLSLNGSITKVDKYNFSDLRKEGEG